MNLSKNISGSPVDYAEASILAREVGGEMLSRLDWVTLKPRVIVEAGCKTGWVSARLAERYPDAVIAAVDLSAPMLKWSQQQKVPAVCLQAEVNALPFQTASVDLVCANLVLPWVADYQAALKEWRRVLKPNGLLMLTAFGLDTLCEWRDMFFEEHLPNLWDMHDLGDGLAQQGFEEPVLDVSHYTMTYREKEKFIHELRATGMLVGAPDLRGLQAVHLSEGDVLSVTYEVAYAHAFAPALRATGTSSAGVVSIPLSALRRQLNR